MTATVDMDGLTPDTRAAWNDFVAAASSQIGFDLVPRSARRTCAQQAEQWAIGRSGAADTRTQTTHAQGCRSWHVLGRAVDFNIFVNGQQSSSDADYTTAGELAESMGWIWGGRFPGFGPNGDEGHVEYHPGLTIEQVCPDPTQCVDVPSSSSSTSSGWITALKVAAGLAVVGLAGWGGVLLANRQKAR